MKQFNYSHHSALEQVAKDWKISFLLIISNRKSVAEKHLLLLSRSATKSLSRRLALLWKSWATLCSSGGCVYGELEMNQLTQG